MVLGCDVRVVGQSTDLSEGNAFFVDLLNPLSVLSALVDDLEQTALLLGVEPLVRQVYADKNRLLHRIHKRVVGSVHGNRDQRLRSGL